tara:strand:- start:679 stop:828 length:150 start_codon:yes stop_codon:yes gene_type:complete
VKLKDRILRLWEIKRKRRSVRKRNVHPGRVESAFVMVNKYHFKRTCYED